MAATAFRIVPPVRCPFQYGSACDSPAGIINLLEFINIENNHRQRDDMALGEIHVMRIHDGPVIHFGNRMAMRLFNLY